MLSKCFKVSPTVQALIVRRSLNLQPVRMMATLKPQVNARAFSMKHYHFDDKDYEPTVTQVSLLENINNF